MDFENHHAAAGGCWVEAFTSVNIRVRCKRRMFLRSSPALVRPLGRVWRRMIFSIGTRLFPADPQLDHLLLLAAWRLPSLNTEGPAEMRRRTAPSQVYPARGGSFCTSAFGPLSVSEAMVRLQYD